jgi:hypothetical protein
VPEPGESTTRMAGVAGRGVGLVILIVPALLLLGLDTVRCRNAPVSAAESV